MSTGVRVLYISYDGMTDPLGRSQVLPYLTRLAGRGHAITILSCEKPDLFRFERNDVQAICDESGLLWRPLRYHRRPPVLSSVYDLARMKAAAAKLHRGARFDLVHCRSDIPGLVGLAMKKRFKVPFLFDMRGFWADEKRESGSWPAGHPLFDRVYHFFKARERTMLRESAGVVSLTEAGRAEIERSCPSSAPVAVIPCCVDFDRFALVGADRRNSAREELGIEREATVLGYVGSLGGNYMLPEMLRFFALLQQRRQQARFLFVTRTDPEKVRREASSLGVAAADLVIRAATHDEVPRLAAAADIGIAFKQASFSAKACCPTKIGEMLALGIPVVANSGVGDVEAILAGSGAGVLVKDFGEEALAGAVAAALALPFDRKRIREEARARLSLEDGVETYDSLYRRSVVGN